MDTDVNTSSSPSISDTLERILAHPEIISMVASAIGAPSPATSSDTKADQKGSTRDSGSKENNDESNESIEKNEIISPSSPKKDASPAMSDVISVLSPLLSEGSIKDKLGGLSPANDNKTCLLRALKPYMNQGRREAIDYMIKLSQISDVLKHLR